jgi:hypothetical protein
METTYYWPRSLTAESISVLRVCPYKFQRRYLEAVPERIFSGLGRGPGELNRAQAGEIVHRCLELLDSAPEDDLPKLVNTAAAALGLSVPTPDLERRIVEMLKRFIYSPWGGILARAEWKEHEIPFVFEVPLRTRQVGAEVENCVGNYSPPPKIRIRGRIDCLMKTREGEMVLLDYKTHDVQDEAISDLLPQHEFQIQIYTYALRQAIAEGRRLPAELDENNRDKNPGAEQESPQPVTAVIWYLQAGRDQEVELWPLEKAADEVASCLSILPEASGKALRKRARLDQVCFACGYYPWDCSGP